MALRPTAQHARSGAALRLLPLLALLGLMLTPRWAWAWTENRVEGLETKVEVGTDGKALVEHHLEMRVNGNVRQKHFGLVGVGAAAEPLGDGYVIPEADALSGKLDAALPLVVTLKDGDLAIDVDDRKGLWRGVFVFVLRYRTDLRATGAITRDGGMTRIRWTGPRLPDGYDNARTTFVLPAAPSPPRSVNPDEDSAEAEEESIPTTYLAEVQRGQEHDEIELLRTYAPKGEGVTWIVRVDPRAVEPPPREEATSAPAPVFRSVRDELATPEIRAGVGAGLFLLVLLLGIQRTREVERLAAAVGATVPGALPLPRWLRVLGAALFAVGGLALQLLFDQPVLGALAVVLASLLVAHGVARPSQARRGPGRWLAITEREGLGPVPPTSGAWLDSSTRLGKVLLVLLLAAHAAGVYALSSHSRLLALQVAFDAVLWLALFGTGRAVTLPPDMAVEPARFYRRVRKRLRKIKGLDHLRLVPRIRIPQGEIDADEMRLGVQPKLPLRGFGGIEIGVTYAIGFGPRVAMPEVLVRVQAGSPCDEALAAVSKRGRITPGRKPEERVIAIAPRFPTPRMTAEIAAALAMRVVDRDALGRKATQRDKPAKPRRRRRRRAAQATEAA